MFAKVKTLSLHGLDAREVTVEADISPGLFSFNIVGLAGKSVQEAKNRVFSAILNSGFDLPMRHITVNLSPAELIKNSTSFDLPIAVAIIIASGQIDDIFKGVYLWGELSLDGKLLPTKGSLPIADEARKTKKKELILPLKNAEEARIVSGINVFGCENLRTVFDFRSNKDVAVKIQEKPAKKEVKDAEINEYDFKFLKGQSVLRRIAEISASGSHNVLLNGVPGSGKTFIARCITSILPSMQFEERVEVTKIYSVSGLLEDNSLITHRPFRSPHHTSSHVSLIGGGAIPKPGEVTLAHRGVLFLDEFPEFETRAIESLRQPMEDKKVNISRASGVMVYPADFMLIAAMNPCKCGYYGDDDPKTTCTCTPYELEKYRSKISGPILDRIDLNTFVSRVTSKDLMSEDLGESSEKVRIRVEKAREIQLERIKSENFKNVFSNSGLKNYQLKKIVNLDKKAKALSYKFIEKLNISARGYYRLLKVARTIADLENSSQIKESHLEEAIGYRLNQ